MNEHSMVWDNSNDFDSPDTISSEKISMLDYSKRNTGIFEWVEERGTGVIPECESWLKRVAVDLYLDPITDFQNSNREENSFLITFGFENMIPE